MGFQPSTGGGGGQTTAWQIDYVDQEDPFVSGYTIPLTQTPIDASVILVYSEGSPSFPTNWEYDSGANAIIILFGADPATDSPTGIWHFAVQYEYAIP